MAKNLKLNIKNTQLAAALNLGKPKEKKQAVSKEPIPEQSPEVKAVEEKIEDVAAKTPEKTPEVISEPTPAPAMTPPAEPPAAAPAPAPPRPPQHQGASPPTGPRPHYHERRPFDRPQRGPTQQDRPPFRPRQDNRPPFRRPEPYRPDTRRPPLGQNMGPRPAPLPTEIRRAEPPRDTPPPVKKPPGFKDYRDFRPSKKQEAGKRSFDSRDKQGLRAGDEDGWRKKRAFKSRAVIEDTTIRPKQLSVRIPITVKDLAVQMKLKASQLLAKLFMQGVVLTLNDLLDDATTIQLLGHEFDCEITIDTTQEKRLRITEESIKEEIKQADADHVRTRAPVVTFMGHVDHGKTSLIDAIRKTNRAAGEAGAITQHIGAFTCHTAVGNLTILDTPGHEAFSAMRSRGADVTDIVVLVVAGDEGIKAQTIEAIQQAAQAELPIIVAINKSDKPGFNPENVYRELADQSLLPEAWGGSIVTINCSAATGSGVKELLEMLALQAEILELKANPNARARGTVIESAMHKGLGAVATLLVQNGTLRLGDALVFGSHWARVKTMHDEHGKEQQEAPPSTPVKITGLSDVPVAGSEFIVVKNEREARMLAEERSQEKQLLPQIKRPAFDSLQPKGAEKKILPLIIRADVQGSLEALKNSLLKIHSAKVELNILSATVGEVSESDVHLAAASKATILGFHTRIESHAESLIKQLKITVRLHNIIYHAIDDVRALMKDLLEKIPQETDTGTAVVKALFKSSQLGIIAGCIVTEGTIARNNHVRVIRGKEMIWKGSISSLKRVKEDVREISKGYECGILLNRFDTLQEGDILQAYEITYLTQEL